MGKIFNKYTHARQYSGPLSDFTPPGVFPSWGPNVALENRGALPVDVVVQDISGNNISYTLEAGQYIELEFVVRKIVSIPENVTVTFLYL